MSSGRPSVRVSVAIPCYRGGATLPAVLDALAPQVESPGREVIVVESTGDRTAGTVAREYPWARVLALPGRVSWGRALNVAVESARGELIATLDSDAIPLPGWLDALERAARAPGVEAVAGAVLNGTPGTVARAAHLLEFADWLPRRSGPVLHAAGCNLLVRRDAWERVGRFPEDAWTGADTVFSYCIGREGRLAFEPQARVAHLNRVSFRSFLWEQHKHGVGAGDIARRVAFPHAPVFRPALAPVAAGVKLLGVVRRLHSPRAAAGAIAVSPLLLAGLVAWSVGLMRSPVLRYPALPAAGR